MAAVSRLPVAALLVILLAAKAASNPVTGGHHGLGRYSRIFGFGNSLTDTGNAAIYPVTAGGSFTRPPYGQTYFGHPSGRASDGRIIIDFLVEELKLPQPLPYLAGKTAVDFANGVNFALGGATALEPDFLRSKALMVFVPVSLVNETNWFKHIVRQHSSSVQAMITAGARTVMVTGMPPLGCAPYLLALFPGGPGDYDPVSGCNMRINDHAELHNRALKLAILKLQVTYRLKSFFYADVYRPIVNVVTSPAKYGFGGTPLAACCGGGGGQYNFNFTTFCGMPGSTTCADPSKYVSWDGIHFTDAANRFIAHAVLGRSSP